MNVIAAHVSQGSGPLRCESLRAINMLQSLNINDVVILVKIPYPKPCSTNPETYPEVFCNTSIQEPQNLHMQMG